MASAIRIENFLKLAAVDSAAAAATTAAAAATTAAATEVNINATAAAVATNHAKVTVTDVDADIDANDYGSNGSKSANELKSDITLDDIKSQIGCAKSATIYSNESYLVNTEQIAESKDCRQKQLISISRSSYYYIDPLSPVLRDIEMTLRCGELVIIAGPVGAGKSTLLSVLLGEMKRCENSDENKGNAENHDALKVCSEPLHTSLQSSSSPPSLPLYPSICSRMAYCAQRPWIVAASVHTNITLAGKHTF